MSDSSAMWPKALCASKCSCIVPLYNPRMRKAVLFPLAVLVAVALTGCGSGGGGNTRTSTNFAVREAITDALAADRSLDQEARGVIASMKSGALPVQQGLDTLVGQTSKVLDLISQVTSQRKPDNPTLTAAQASMEDYLRQREFQLESTIQAKSGAEAEAAYANNQQAVDAARQKVRLLLVKYDPGLEKSLP